MTESFDVEDDRAYVGCNNDERRKSNREAYDNRKTPVHWRNKQRRFIGKQDITDVPPGMSLKVMPMHLKMKAKGRPEIEKTIGWRCPRCFTKHLCFVFKCVVCGAKSPLGNVNWRR